MLQDGRNAIVVDPEDAAPVFDALARGNLQLAAILVTHHHPDHPDHTGGAAALREAGLPAQCAQAEVFAALRQWKNDFR